MAAPAFTISKNGSFSINAGSVRLSECYPHMDGVPLHPVSVEIKENGKSTDIVYTLSEGKVYLNLEKSGKSAAVSAKLEEVPSPHWFCPVGGAVISGCKKMFRQGIGFSGPSGFVSLEEEHPVSYESYLATGLVGEQTLALGALDYTDYLYRTRVYTRILRSDFLNRRIERIIPFLEAGFSVEHIHIPENGLHFPAIHFTEGTDPWDTLRSQVQLLADAGLARTHQPPAYHYCSWYDKRAEYSMEDLTALLDGLGDDPEGLQTIQIDAGHSITGDWLIPRTQYWPGGMKAAAEAIKAKGLRAGIWIGPFMVNNGSDVYKNHQDWLLKDLEGNTIKKGQNWGPGGERTDTYVLDTSHPDAFEHIKHVFSTLHEWGFTFYKTDFMDWGFYDSTLVKRYTPGKTSAQYYNEMISGIREAIGDESYWLGCIAYFGPMAGYVDGIRTTSDVGESWTKREPTGADGISGGTQNMVQETAGCQYFNNVLWQHDPDVIFIRDWKIEMSEEEKLTMALLAGVTGGSVNTSDAIHRLNDKAGTLWRFLRPGSEHVTALMPYFGEDVPFHVFVRPYETQNSWAVFAMNPGNEKAEMEITAQDILGIESVTWHTWGPFGLKKGLEKTGKIITLDAHESVLFYVNTSGDFPPEGLTLGGYLG